MLRLRISLAFLHENFRNPLNRSGDFLIGAKTLATSDELRYRMFAPEQTNGFDRQFAGFEIA